MKIVETDNHGSDYPYECLVLAGLPQEAAQKIADIINEHLCPSDYSSRFWKVVPEEYVLNTAGPND